MCMVRNGQAPFKFLWKKDGKDLKNSDIKVFEKVASLTIDPVEKSSSGNYTCIVSNSFGKNTYSAVLKVKGMLH